ncbi:formin-like protein 6 [Triticum urartu]|uniref:formin-like protein 6 n=1 Tax=Triticum urartu TaxID=4572 RepID=UPI002044129B|nr:formin-like protein 6 [Triticum urartu]
MRRKRHARAMPCLCPPLKLGRELARELEKPLPRLYKDPRTPPHLTILSPFLLPHWSASPRRFLLRPPRPPPEFVSIPATASPLSSSQALHYLHLLPAVRPNPLPLAGEPRGCASRSLAVAVALGHHTDRVHPSLLSPSRLHHRPPRAPLSRPTHLSLAGVAHIAKDHRQPPPSVSPRSSSAPRPPLLPGAVRPSGRTRHAGPHPGWSWPGLAAPAPAAPLSSSSASCRGQAREEEEDRGRREKDKVGPACHPLPVDPATATSPPSENVPSDVSFHGFTALLPGVSVTPACRSCLDCLLVWCCSCVRELG